MRDITALQEYCNVGPTYSSVTTIFVLVIALTKTDLNWYVSAVIFHGTFAGGISETSITIYVCFPIDRG